MGTYLFTHGLREFFRLQRSIWWILISAFVAGVGVLWPQITRHQGTTAEQYGTVSAMLVFHMVALCSAIYTTSIISQEVEQKTIVYLLTRPVPRWKLLLARYLASVVVVATLSIFSALLLSAVMFHGAPLSNPLLAKDIAAIIVGAFAYGALFLWVSLLFNRAMIICVLFAFAWEWSVPNLPGDLYHLSVFSHMQAIAEHASVPLHQGGMDKKSAFLSGELGTNLISAGSAYPTMIITTLVLVAICLWWFTRFEYVPREDAE